MDKVTGAITTVGGYLNTFQDFVSSAPRALAHARAPPPRALLLACRSLARPL